MPEFDDFDAASIHELDQMTGALRKIAHLTAKLADYLIEEGMPAQAAYERADTLLTILIDEMISDPQE